MSRAEYVRHSAASVPTQYSAEILPKYASFWSTRFSRLVLSIDSKGFASHCCRKSCIQLNLSYSMWFFLTCKMCKISSGSARSSNLFPAPQRTQKFLGLKIVQCSLSPLKGDENQQTPCILLQMCEQVKSISYCRESHTLRWDLLKYILRDCLIWFLSIT